MTSTNDEKDVKSNQTSGPKGKTYYIELYKSLESALTSASPLSERTEALCAAWTRVHRLCAHSASTTQGHLLAWVQRHTARVILQTEWQSPASVEYRLSLDSALASFLSEAAEAAAVRNGVAPDWEAALVQRAEWFRKTVPEPWGHPVLRKLLDQSGPQPTHQEILEWLKEERGVIFVTRLRQLASSKCNDLALALTTAVMDRVRASAVPEEHTDGSSNKEESYRETLTSQCGFTFDVWELLVDLEFVLLHKLGRTSRCIQLAKETPLRTGYQLVERLRTRLETSPREKKLWKNGSDVATIIAQVIVTRCMVTPVCSDAPRAALYCCTRSLVRLLPPARLPAAAAALAAPAATPRHLHTLAAATEAQCTEEMKPFVCELYVRAITAGMNELERLKVASGKDTEARNMEQTVATWFVQLGKLLSASPRIKCECALTAFSMHPSPAMFERLKEAPPLPSVMDKTDVDEAPKSSFGSWANDSHGRTNFVKTSETLKLKGASKQTNVLSTALLTEGETLGLSAELCQDIAALLSGPRLKTLSWDMDRNKLLEVCRGHMERTGCGTRTLTTELRYLNIDPREWQHLPEEDDGEGDLYYGIERGYEHLVELPEPEPEEIWADALVTDSDRMHSTDSSSTDHDDYFASQHKKKRNRSKKSEFVLEEVDPLSLPSDRKEPQPTKEKPTEKKDKPRKDRPKGDERCKTKNKKKRETSQERRKEMKAQKKREKKERKKLEHTALPARPVTSLASLIGLKVCASEDIQPDLKIEKNMQKEKKKKPPIDGLRLSSESDSHSVQYDGQFYMDDFKTVSPPKPQLQVDLLNDLTSPKPAINASIPSPSPSIPSPLPNLPQSPGYTTKSPVCDDVKNRITKLLAFRRQKPATSSPLSSPNASSTQGIPTAYKEGLTNSSASVEVPIVSKPNLQLQVNPLQLSKPVTNTPLISPSIQTSSLHGGRLIINNNAGVYPASANNVPQATKFSYNNIPATVTSQSQRDVTPTMQHMVATPPTPKPSKAKQPIIKQNISTASKHTDIGSYNNLPATVTSQIQRDFTPAMQPLVATPPTPKQPNAKQAINKQNTPTAIKPTDIASYNIIPATMTSQIQLNVTPAMQPLVATPPTPKQPNAKQATNKQKAPTANKLTEIASYTNIPATMTSQCQRDVAMQPLVPTQTTPKPPKAKLPTKKQNTPTTSKVTDQKSSISTGLALQNYMPSPQPNQPNQQDKKVLPSVINHPWSKPPTPAESPRKIYGMKDFISSLLQAEYKKNGPDANATDAVMKRLIEEEDTSAKALQRKLLEDAPKTFSRRAYYKNSKQKQMSKKSSEQEAISKELERHITEFQKLKALHSQGTITIGKVEPTKPAVTVEPKSTTPTKYAQANPVLTSFLNAPSPIKKDHPELLRTNVPLTSMHIDQKEILSLLHQQNNLVGKTYATANDKKNILRTTTPNIVHTSQYQSPTKVNATKVPNSTVTNAAQANVAQANVAQANVAQPSVAQPSVANMMQGYQNEFNKMVEDGVLVSNNKNYVEYDEEPIFAPWAYQSAFSNTTAKKDLQAPKPKAKSKRAPKKNQAQISNDLVSVMDALRYHKTPSRGPNALELALNKNASSNTPVVIKKVPQTATANKKVNQQPSHVPNSGQTPTVPKQTKAPEANTAKPLDFTISRLIENEIAYQMNAKKIKVEDPEKLVTAVKCMFKPDPQKTTQNAGQPRSQSIIESMQIGSSTVTKVKAKRAPKPKAPKQPKPTAVPNTPVAATTVKAPSTPVEIKKELPHKQHLIHSGPPPKTVVSKTFDIQTGPNSVPKLVEVPKGAITITKKIKIQEGVILKPGNIPKECKPPPMQKRLLNKPTLPSIQEDYPLLDELMDKDLLEEIDELLSEEEMPKNEMSVNKAPPTANVVHKQIQLPIQSTSANSTIVDAMKSQNYVGLRVMHKPGSDPITKPTPPVEYTLPTTIPQRNDLTLAAVPVSNILLLRPNIVTYPSNTQVFTQGPLSSYIVKPAPNLALYQTTQYAAPVVNQIIIGNATPVHNLPVDNVSLGQIQTQQVHGTTESTEALDNTSVEKTPTEKETKPKKKIEILEQITLKFDYTARGTQRKVLHEVQEKQNAPPSDGPAKPEKITVERVKEKETVVEKKEKVIRKDSERVKIKRQAILNREINQRSNLKPIPLIYEPLISVTSIAKSNIPLEDTSDSPSEFPKSEAIKEVAKENSVTDSAYRRILLRSSNKVTNKPKTPPKIAKKPIQKKPKAEPKKTPVSVKADRLVDKTPTRVSKRKLNKRLLLKNTEDKTVLPENNTNVDDTNKMIDIEDELSAVEIPKVLLNEKKTIPELKEQLGRSHVDLETKDDFNRKGKKLKITPENKKPKEPVSEQNNSNKTVMESGTKFVKEVLSAINESRQQFPLTHDLTKADNTNDSDKPEQIPGRAPKIDNNAKDIVSKLQNASKTKEEERPSTVTEGNEGSTKPSLCNTNKVKRNTPGPLRSKQVQETPDPKTDSLVDFMKVVKIDSVVYLPTEPGAPSKKCIQITLPNNKTYKVTVSGSADVDVGTLFANPDIRKLITCSWDETRKYRVNILHDPKNRTPLQVVGSQQLQVPGEIKVTDTIDLISDDEVDPNARLKTEFGFFEVTARGTDLEQLQKDMNRKCYVKLTKHPDSFFVRTPTQITVESEAKDVVETSVVEECVENITNIVNEVSTVEHVENGTATVEKVANVTEKLLIDEATKEITKPSIINATVPIDSHDVELDMTVDCEETITKPITVGKVIEPTSVRRQKNNQVQDAAVAKAISDHVDDKEQFEGEVYLKTKIVSDVSPTYNCKPDQVVSDDVGAEKTFDAVVSSEENSEIGTEVTSNVITASENIKEVLMNRIDEVINEDNMISKDVENIDKDAAQKESHLKVTETTAKDGIISDEVVIHNEENVDHHRPKTSGETLQEEEPFKDRILITQDQVDDGEAILSAEDNIVDVALNDIRAVTEEVNFDQVARNKDANKESDDSDDIVFINEENIKSYSAEKTGNIIKVSDNSDDIEFINEDLVNIAQTKQTGNAAKNPDVSDDVIIVDEDFSLLSDELTSLNVESIPSEEIVKKLADEIWKDSALNSTLSTENPSLAILPDVIELDSSSGDECENGEKSSVLLEDKINEFKNLLLNDLGGLSNAIPNRQDSNVRKNIRTRSVSKPAKTPKPPVLYKESFVQLVNCDELVEKYKIQNAIIQRKCVIQLIKFDHMIENNQESDSEIDFDFASPNAELNRSGSPSILNNVPWEEDINLDLLDDSESETTGTTSPVMEIYDIVCKLNEKCKPSKVALENINKSEGRTSPVIEIFDIIAKQNKNYGETREINVIKCNAEWFVTKLTKHQTRNTLHTKSNKTCDSPTVTSLMSMALKNLNQMPDLPATPSRKRKQNSKEDNVVMKKNAKPLEFEGKIHLPKPIDNYLEDTLKINETDNLKSNLEMDAKEFAGVITLPTGECVVETLPQEQRQIKYDEESLKFAETETKQSNTNITKTENESNSIESATEKTSVLKVIGNHATETESKICIEVDEVNRRDCVPSAIEYTIENRSNHSPVNYYNYNSTPVLRQIIEESVIPEYPKDVSTCNADKEPKYFDQESEASPVICDKPSSNDGVTSQHSELENANITPDELTEDVIINLKDDSVPSKATENLVVQSKESNCTEDIQESKILDSHGFTSDVYMAELSEDRPADNIDAIQLKTPKAIDALAVTASTAVPETMLVPLAEISENKPAENFGAVEVPNPAQEAADISEVTLSTIATGSSIAPVAEISEDRSVENFDSIKAVKISKEDTDRPDVTSPTMNSETSIGPIAEILEVLPVENVGVIQVPKTLEEATDKPEATAPTMTSETSKVPVDEILEVPHVDNIDAIQVPKTREEATDIHEVTAPTMNSETSTPPVAEIEVLPVENVDAIQVPNKIEEAIDIPEVTATTVNSETSIVTVAEPFEVWHVENHDAIQIPDRHEEDTYLPVVTACTKDSQRSTGLSIEPKNPKAIQMPKTPNDSIDVPTIAYEPMLISDALVDTSTPVPISEASDKSMQIEIPSPTEIYETPEPNSQRANLLQQSREIKFCESINCEMTDKECKAHLETEENVEDSVIKKQLVEKPTLNSVHDLESIESGPLDIKLTEEVEDMSEIRKEKEKETNTVMKICQGEKAEALSDVQVEAIAPVVDKFDCRHMTDTWPDLTQKNSEVPPNSIDFQEKCYVNILTIDSESPKSKCASETPKSPIIEVKRDISMHEFNVPADVEPSDENNCSFSKEENATISSQPIPTLEPKHPAEKMQSHDETIPPDQKIVGPEAKEGPVETTSVGYQVSLNNAPEESSDTQETAYSEEYDVNSPLPDVGNRESSTPIDYANQPGIILKGIEFKDPIVGTCYFFRPIDDSVSDTASVKTDLNESDSLNESAEVYEIVKILDVDEMTSPEEYNNSDSLEVAPPESKPETPGPQEKEDTLDFELRVRTPKFTYRNLKRKLSPVEVNCNKKRYKKGKQIDCPKLSSTAIKACAFGSEYKSLMDYIDTVEFSYSRPFHKDCLDVDGACTNWPIAGPIIKQEKDVNEDMDTALFNEVSSTDKEQTNSDPLQKPLVEELSADIGAEITTSIERETNFNMGFGEKSGSVIQNLKEGVDISKFSAATLSDVKPIQPFLHSTSDGGGKDPVPPERTGDQKDKLIRSFKYIQLKEKVRSFFAKMKLDLAENSAPKNWKEDPYKWSVFRNVPGLYSTEFLVPQSNSPIVNVVQVGQLPVSAAAQNPVTIDPRVTQVSDASPPQCSVENSPRSDTNQTTIKAEYTELTNADLSLPLVQDLSEQTQSATVKENDDVTSEQTVIPKEVEIRTEMKERLDLSSENSTSEPKQPEPADFNYENSSTNETPPVVSNDMPELFDAPTKQAEESCQSSPKRENGSVEKTDQIAHAMNAAGITTTPEDTVTNSTPHPLVNLISQKVIRTSPVNTVQPTNNYQKTSINAMAIQQALAQILPPPLNQTTGENGQPATNTTHAPQVLHIVQGNNASGNQITLVDNSQQSVINTPNATQVLHIVQNKSAAGTPSNGNPNPQNFSGLSLVDAGLQQGGNQLLHIVNTGNQKNANATGQLLKRVNLLTNLTNVQGGNEQKMVQFVCKSADGKSIHLNAPHQRSMVLRLQPIETPNVQANLPKPVENPELSPTSSQSKDAANQQEIKSRSIYEENYAKFIQNSAPKALVPPEKSTSLPKFNQAFGKATFQEGTTVKNEINNSPHMTQDNAECPPVENTMNLDHLTQISSPPLLVRKTATATSQAQQNLVQQIKQSIAPMNMTMHGGVIYTRQIPVNIGGGQTINLITVPTTELIDENGQKQPGEIEAPIIKIVPQTQTNSEGNADENTHLTNAGDNPPTPQPQQVLTQMRIKLPMLSKTPQVVQGARAVRPAFFQIQRNMIGGANQGQVYQQLVLTAAPPLGQQTIRLPQAPVRQVKVQPETPSPSESQLSSSTLEQLREFDMVLEQVKERSTVQPSGSSSNTFQKIHTTSTDTTDSNSSVSASSTTTDHTQQVLYSIGNSSTMNVAYVNRKTTVTTPTTSTYVRSPDSSGIVDSPSSTSQIPQTATETAPVATSSTSEPSSSNSQPKAAKVGSKSMKSRPKPTTATPSALAKVSNPIPPKTSTQKPLEDEQTTQRILYILAEYKEQVENSPDKDKPAPRRRSNPPSNPGSSKRKKSSSGSRRHGCTRDHSPIDDNCRTMGSEDSSCGTSQGDCTESCSIDAHSPQDSPRKVVRKLTFEHETPLLTQQQPRVQPPRNVIVADGQTITVARSATGKPTTAVLMPANYILPVSMMKGGQQIAIVTNRGPKLLTVGGAPGEAGAANALLLQRLIGPAGLKPVLARPGVRHVRLPATALHNLQAFNLQAVPTPQPADSTASPAAPTPPELVETRANSSPWAEREPSTSEGKPDRGSSPEASEPWHLQSSSGTPDYTYEEAVTSRADSDRTVLHDPDRYSPDMEAQRIFDKMFDVEKKGTCTSYIGVGGESPRHVYDIDATHSDCEEKSYHQVVQKKDGSTHGLHRVTHISSAALRHKYAILEHELRLQKSLSEECSDLGVDSPSASDLFPEAELLFASSPAHDHSHHATQPSILSQSTIPQPDLDDQIATDDLLPPVRDHDLTDDHRDLTDDVNLGLGDVGIVTVSEDGSATIALDQEEFARAHPNTTFHSEPTDVGDVVQPFSIASGLAKGRHITSTIFHSGSATATVLMTAPQQTVISQATHDTNHINTVKYADIDNMINSLPANDINLSSVLVKDDGLTRFDSILTDSRELHLSNTAAAIIHPNVTQVIRRVCYDDDAKRDRDRFLMDDNDGLIAGDDAKMSVPEESSRDATMDSMGPDDEDSSPERHAELFWESNSASERSESRRPLDFSSDSEKCKSPSLDETNSTDSSGVGTHLRLDSVIKEARARDRSGSVDNSSADDTIHPPIRTYPPKRSFHNEGEVERSLSGKTRAGERSSPDSPEVRRRASNRGVVKRGCHCCNGSPAPPRPKKPRQRKPTLDFANSN